MMDIFHYRQIGESLFADLYNRVEAGDSLALITHRYGGGRYTMDRLCGRLQESGLGPLFFLNLSHREPVRNEAELRLLLERETVQEALPGDPLLVSVDRSQKTESKPVILLVSNIDSLPYGLTRALLEEIRTRVQRASLVAVLSGEDNFSGLVHGPNSDFDCVERFFLQGLDEAEFSRFFDPYLRWLHLSFVDHGAACRQLWDWTGGDRHLLRMILLDLMDRLIRSSSKGAESIATEDLYEMLESMYLPNVYGTEILEHAVRLIDHEPQCWHDLQALIDGEPVTTSGEHSPPGPLELAGVAVRHKAPVDQVFLWKLGFSSILVTRFIQSHYHTRRWGDLYARTGQLEQAFDFYGEVPWEAGSRPSTADDRIDTELTVRSLAGPLNAAVLNGSAEVRRLFARCCQCVLGYRDVVYWRYRGGAWHLNPEESWVTVQRDAFPDPTQILPAGNRISGGVLPVPPKWEKFLFAAVFPAHREDEQNGLMLGDFTTKALISRPRKQLTGDFFASFLAAHSQAIQTESFKERMSIRNGHREVINSIFDSLGSRILDVRNALALAARGLRKSGYCRVMFSLVNPEGDRIKGELDDSEDLRVNIAEMTDWPLSDPRADLQPYVIFTREPKVVENPSREPLANPKVLQATRMKPFVIVPLLSPTREAIGTVHIERTDGAVPSGTEVEDLLRFGRQLAIAIEQSERVNLLQSALNRMPEPVLITDRSRRLRYANEPAAELFDLAADWRGRSNAEELLTETLSQPIDEQLNRSLRDGVRQLRHVHEILGREYHGAALSDAIEDWRDRTVGAMLHIEDLNYLYRILSAIQVIAEANDTDSAMRSMLKAAGLLGHERGRLFLVKKEDPDALVGQLALERSCEIQEARRVVLPRRGEPESRTWLCIEGREPLVFCWNEQREDAEVIVTPAGLYAINANPPKCPNEIHKAPGNFWIDFPLITKTAVLGKLSLSCDENLQPEQFELIKMLAAMASGLFDAFLRRDQMHDQMVADSENRALWAAAEETMAFAAHNIATRLASLAVLLARYRRREHLAPDLKKLNDEFGDLYTEVMQTISRIKERLSFVKPDRRRIDIAAKIRGVLGSALPAESWSFHASTSPLEADCDSHLLGNALLEMIENSRDLIPASKSLHIEVELASQQLLTGEWIQIIYRDNGPGIPQDLKGEIFKPFFTRRPGRKTGIGLGLTFVRHVVDAHAGAISEMGEPGEGARFFIGFPRFLEDKSKEADHVPV